VKYHDIEEELILKFKNNSEDCEYDKQDILDICDKLYRDELLSVFYINDFLDNKFEASMKSVLEEMLVNPKFKIMFDDMVNVLCMEKSKSNSDIIDINDSFKLNDNLKMFVLLTLFIQSIFYITHQCICQQLTLGTIDDHLLVELKTKTMDILTNNK
jgi:hypothetical protein